MQKQSFSTTTIQQGQRVASTAINTVSSSHFLICCYFAFLLLHFLFLISGSRINHPASGGAIPEKALSAPFLPSLDLNHSLNNLFNNPRCCFVWEAPFPAKEMVPSTACFHSKCWNSFFGLAMDDSKQPFKSHKNMLLAWPLDDLFVWHTASVN